METPRAIGSIVFRGQVKAFPFVFGRSRTERFKLSMHPKFNVHMRELEKHQLRNSRLFVVQSKIEIRKFHCRTRSAAFRNGPHANAPARPYKPRNKAAVEAAFGVIQRQFFTKSETLSFIRLKNSTLFGATKSLTLSPAELDLVRA